MKSLSEIDRRSTKRFPVKEGAFAFMKAKNDGFVDIDDMSMGEIAIAVIKSNPSKMGQITDLSKDGMAFQYISYDCIDKETCGVHLLLADQRMLVENLPFRTVADFEVSDNVPFSPLKTKKISIQFKELTHHQKKQLDAFIQHTKGDG